MDLGTYFILSQIFMFMAMISDFLSMQFKNRKYMLLCLAVSSSLISTHYFLLGKMAAGVIIAFSVLRFITACFVTDKRLPYLFIGLNTISLFFTYASPYDLICYAAVIICIIGTFQNDDKYIRRWYMVGTSCIIIYNAIIFSPMGVVAEGSFLISNFIGYYRHYVRKK
jgi:hypothetical protein